MKTQLEKELKGIESEMESAFKLQMTASADSQAAQFCIEKIEVLGNKKKDLMKRLGILKETDTNVISMSEAKQNLFERTEAVTRGWAKTPDVQKRKALKRLIKKILIGSEGMDIYYYYNSLAEEKSLGVLSVENENIAKVLSFRTRGTEFLVGNSEKNKPSKERVENCLLEEMVNRLQGKTNRFKLLILLTSRS